VRFQFRTAPVLDLEAVAVNVPRAAPTSPVGAGTSSEALRTVVSWMRSAWLRATAAPAAVRARPSPTTAAVILRAPSCMRFSFDRRFCLLYEPGR
jgi:hypothetical protein